MPYTSIPGHSQNYPGNIVPGVGVPAAGFSTAQGQAQALVKQIYYVHGQAKAHIKITGIGFGQAQAQIRQTYFGFGQARASIVYTRWALGQANARIIRDFPGGGGPPGQQPEAPNFGPPEYVVVYNGFQLPGYAQSESLITTMDLANFESWDWDGSKTQQAGLTNQAISMDFLIHDFGGWRTVKERYDYAEVILRSSQEEWRPLYIDYTDRHWMAVVKQVKYDKTAYESRRTLLYTVDFECEPAAVAELPHIITGSGTLTTDVVGRTIASGGGWTPATFTITGTNVTVSGYTDTEFTGYISVSGQVTDLIIDSELFTSSLDGENADHLMRWTDYATFVGAGKTTFVTTGATEVTITYYDRWY